MASKLTRWVSSGFRSHDGSFERPPRCRTVSTPSRRPSCSARRVRSPSIIRRRGCSRTAARLSGPNSSRSKTSTSYPSSRSVGTSHRSEVAGAAGHEHALGHVLPPCRLPHNLDPGRWSANRFRGLGALSRTKAGFESRCLALEILQPPGSDGVRTHGQRASRRPGHSGGRPNAGRRGVGRFARQRPRREHAKTSPPSDLSPLPSECAPLRSTCVSLPRGEIASSRKLTARRFQASSPRNLIAATAKQTAPKITSMSHDHDGLSVCDCSALAAARRSLTARSASSKN